MWVIVWLKNKYWIFPVSDSPKILKYLNPQKGWQAFVMPLIIRVSMVRLFVWPSCILYQKKLLGLLLVFIHMIFFYFQPPRVKCLTRLWHPNINVDGDVCLSLLRQTSIDEHGWAPTRRLKDVVWGLNALFTVSVVKS